MGEASYVARRFTQKEFCSSQIFCLLKFLLRKLQGTNKLKEVINELIPEKKSWILKYVKRKTKDNLQIFFWIWNLELGNGMLKIVR